MHSSWFVAYEGKLYRVDFEVGLTEPHNPFELLTWIVDADIDRVDSGEIVSTTDADQIGVRIAEWVEKGFVVFND